MSVRPLTRDSLPYFHDALNRLAPETARQWGQLTAIQMVCHLRRTFEISLGEINDPQLRDMSYPVLRSVIYWFFFVQFTNWPKGKIKAPEVFTPEAEGSLETERRILFECIDRFVAEHTDHPDRRTLTPLLGYITLRRWSQVHGVHLHHHLRQFGLIP
ncbi:MAG: hypothetical protein AMXMBFR84_01170 [Candidatus Hydrogenedentota bacterium]